MRRISYIAWQIGNSARQIAYSLREIGNSGRQNSFFGHRNLHVNCPVWDTAGLSSSESGIGVG
jgi:hypothetical protein